MKDQSSKKWFLKCVFTLCAFLIFIAAVVIFVDPYFHYHKPFSFLSYRLYEERYINDGISRNFDYDSVITGTSMSQNFKTSEFDSLFGTTSVKMPLAGAGYQEITENLARTLKRNDSVTTVLWALDYNGLLRPSDWEQYEGYPSYLYDNNPFNDVSYVFNKSILYHGVLTNLAMTLKGSESTSFDDYSSWDREAGLDAILCSYTPSECTKAEDNTYTDADKKNVTQTITENFISLIRENPDVTFYIFYPPYSICHFDALNRQDLLNKQLMAEQTATELLLEYPNVKLYNFFDQYDVICNLDYYSDPVHYSAEVSSYILQWISDGTGLVTKENYPEKLAQAKKFFTDYDYDSIYQ